MNKKDKIGTIVSVCAKTFIGLLLFALIAFTAMSCHFFATLTAEETDDSTISFSSSNVSISIGEMDAVSVSISENQSSKNITWSYDNSVISAITDNYGIILTGLTSGTTTVKAMLPNGNYATCYVEVSSSVYSAVVTNPYVYASSDFVEVTPGNAVKISAFLYGGTSSDIYGYTWSIDKSSVASLYTEGNYCWITGANEGMAKLTIRHNKAAYPYTVLISCSSDGTTSSYITTSDNIVTINMTESNSGEFSVDLKNPLTESYASGFTYSLVDTLGNELSSAPVTISGAGSLSVTLHAYSVGECFVRCSHPSAAYSLDVLVRVVKDNDISYIDVSDSIVTISGTDTYTVSASLINFSGIEDSDSWNWTFSEGASDIISWSDYDNTLFVTGKKTGCSKAVVSYPGLSSRSVVFIVQDLETEAASATTYITTSQNYVRLSPSSDDVRINITLTDCDSGDINNLKWNIVNFPDDGSSNVIKWNGGNGTSSSKISTSRSAALTYSEAAYGIIEPVSTGTAYIDISHPKAIYPTRITVVVSEASSSSKSSVLTLKGNPKILIQNGSSETVSLAFSGAGNTSDIIWESASESLILSPNENECTITAPQSGSGLLTTTVTASHEYASYPLTYSVVCYESDEDLENLSFTSIYSLETTRSLYVGNETSLNVSFDGFDTEPVLNWTCDSGLNSVITLESVSGTSVKVQAVATGTAVVRASYEGCSDVIFVIKVTDPSVMDENIDCYLSTTTNVVYFESINTSKDISVYANNINASAYSSMVWTCDSPYFELAYNGTSCTVKSLSSNATGTITVTHPLSLNELTIYLKCGSQYEYINSDVCYITTDSDVLNLYAGQDEVSLIAKLNHTASDETSSDSTAFIFTSSNEDVASVTYVANSSVCYVYPKTQGTCKITVTNPSASYAAEVAVIVDKTADADSIPYLTTDQNVISFIAGDYTTVSVSLVNSTNIENSKFTWLSSDTRVVDVVANNGSTAMLSGLKAGAAQITVKHTDCAYSLKLIVTVLDSSISSSTPYISTSNSIVSLDEGNSVTVTAKMLGEVSDGCERYFKWSCSDSSVCAINGSYGSCYIKALSEGMTYITVSNSKYSSSYARTILVVVNEAAEDGCYITTSQSIVKMKPTNTSGTTITATLVNGEETDAQDFIWWADDYNIVNITSITNTCSIIPTGISGTTKIHVKHAKASKQVDILVLVSAYDSFSFSTTSANIIAEKLYFFPLQTPAIDDDYTIEFTSSNENVCIIDGTDSVAFVCGRSYGTAILAAKMISSTGVEIASAELLVSVSVTEKTVPVISTGSSIITLEGGTSQVFTATVSGNSLTGGEEYQLMWEVLNGDSGISINDGPDPYTAFGQNCYVTVQDLTAEYVIKVSLPGTDAYTTLYVKVEEKGNIEISLSSYLETCYKDDGSFTLTAELTNASTSDYQNISWSAVKVNGANIVAVSKAKGATCTVTPKTTGQTTVIARLPNGTQAKCIVIVKASAEVSFSTGAVHVIPGYTVAVPYTTNPESATMNWFAEYTTSSSALGDGIVSYFTFEDDAANKQLLITGKVDLEGSAAGTISGYMSGSSSANIPKLTVYVEYNVTLEAYQHGTDYTLTLLSTNRPDSNNIQTFDVLYYPKDLVITLSGYESLCNLYDYSDKTVTSNGIEMIKRTYSLQPKTEGDATITLYGKLPNDSSGAYSKSVNFSYSAYYSSYTIKAHFMNEQVGAFSEYKDNTIYLGDGEQVQFYLTIEEENAAGKLGTPTLTLNNTITAEGHISTEFGLNNDITNVSSNRDKLKEKLFNNNYYYKGTIPSNDKYLSNSSYYYDNWKKNVIAGAMSFTNTEIDTDSDGKKDLTLYTLAHNFDWYKDVPYIENNDISTAEGWKAYYDAHQKDSDLISKCIEKGVDYWTLYGVPYYNNNSTYYPLDFTNKYKTSFTKKNLKIITESESGWIPGKATDGSNNNGFLQYDKDGLKISINLEYINNNSWFANDHYPSHGMPVNNNAFPYMLAGTAWQTTYLPVLTNFYGSQTTIRKKFATDDVIYPYRAGSPFSHFGTHSNYSVGKILNTTSLKYNSSTLYSVKDLKIDDGSETEFNKGIPIFSKNTDDIICISSSELQCSALLLSNMRSDGINPIDSPMHFYDTNVVYDFFTKKYCPYLSTSREFSSSQLKDSPSTQSWISALPSENISFTYTQESISSSENNPHYCYSNETYSASAKKTWITKTTFNSMLQCYAEVIRPTVTKDITPHRIAELVVTIPYTNGKNVSKTPVTINVCVERRDCEAYSNNNWETYRNGQFVYTGNNISVTSYGLDAPQTVEVDMSEYEETSSNIESGVELLYSMLDVSESRYLQISGEQFSIMDNSKEILITGSIEVLDSIMTFTYDNGEGKNVSESFNYILSENNDMTISTQDGNASILFSTYCSCELASMNFSFIE